MNLTKNDIDYTARFVNSSLAGRSLKLPLPQQFTFAVNSTWSPFSTAGLLEAVNFLGEKAGSLLGRGLLGKAAGLGTKALNYGIKAQNKNAFLSAFAQQYWESTNPIDIQLRFELVAFEDAAKEVMGKIEQLGKIGLPRKGKSSEITGGATLEKLSGAIIGTEVTGEAIFAPSTETSLFIGRNIYFPKVIITNITPTFEVKPDKNGNYIEATVDVSIRTSTIPTQDTFNFSKSKSTEESKAIAAANK